MTREEHLKFCKQCTNRKMSDEGLICKITEKKADFEDTCENFNQDESVDGRSTWEKMQEHKEEELQKLEAHSDLFFAIIGGLFVSIICALVWAVITVTTEYQIGYMAIGVGLAVGYGVRYFGAGIVQTYGIIGGFFALFGCALGNLFSQIGFAAIAQNMGYFEILTLLDFDTIIAIFEESFGPMDLVFYGIAVVEGYKFAFRPIPENLHELEDAPPPNAHLRKPLVIASFVLLSISFYVISQGASGPQTYYYDSGAIYSQGELENGAQQGEWTYFYENGKPYLKGNFVNGIENGEWTWYYESGITQKIAEYSNGLFNGIVVTYYPEGNVMDSSNYKEGRVHGKYRSFHENGSLQESGEYIRDKAEGPWTLFYENGQQSVQLSFTDGEINGEALRWFEDGSPQNEMVYIESNISEIINAWNQSGEQLVTNGNGTFISYYEDGSTMEAGPVVNKKKSGTWKSFYQNGQIKELGVVRDDQYFLEKAWTYDGEDMITDGNGLYTIYNDDDQNLMLMSGEYKDGLQHGNWLIYYPNSILLQSDQNWKNGKLHGMQLYFYESGPVQIEGSLENEERDGLWTWYYETGGIHSQVNYVDGKKSGDQTFYSELGAMVKIETYDNGELTGEEVLKP